MNINELVNNGFNTLLDPVQLVQAITIITITMQGIKHHLKNNATVNTLRIINLSITLWVFTAFVIPHNFLIQLFNTFMVMYLGATGVYSFIKTKGDV